MSLANEVKSDIREAKKLRLRLRWWGKLCVIIGLLPVIWLFDHFGKLDLFLPTVNCVAVLGFMLALKRKLWPHGWFWITMTVIASLHVVLILFVPWGTKWVPALVIAGIDSVDFCLILWVFDAVGRLVEGPKAAQK